MQKNNDHHHTWQKVGANLHFSRVIDAWLGPTAGIVHCDDCGNHALVHLVAWRGEQCEWRIFGVRILETTTLNTYEANINREYCDLTRKQAETEALFASLAPDALLIEWHVAQDKVTRVSSETHRAAPKDWQMVKDQDFNQWSPFLASPVVDGIEKIVSLD